MTHKSMNMNNTILFILPCLLLLVTTVSGKYSYNSSAQLTAEVPHELKSIYAGHPVRELLDDRRLIVASYISKQVNAQPTIISIELIGQNGTERGCNISTSKIMYATRRLSEKTVLVPLHDKNEEKFKLLVVNTKNCKSAFASDRYINNLQFDQIFTNANFSDERFTVITKDKEYCEGYDWCRLYFDPMFFKLEPLQFNFPTHEIEIVNIQMATSYNDNLLVVHLVDNNGTYIVRLCDLLADPNGPLCQELFSIPGYKTKGAKLGKTFYDHLNMIWYEMTSSGLSFSYHMKRNDEDPNVVHCLRFREDGSLMFNQTVVYQEVMRNNQVKTIPNGLILFGKRDCLLLTEACSTVRIAVITSEFESIDCERCSSSSNLLGNEIMRIKHRRYNTHCKRSLAVRYQVRANVTDGSLEVKYVCYGVSHFSYGVFYI